MVRKIILYIATSRDGFIAKKNGNIDWLIKYENSSEDYGFKELFDRIGTIFIGGKTYRQIEDSAEKAYLGKEVYVFSRKKSKSKLSNIHFVSGEVKKVVENLKFKDDKDIWLVGGADLANQFLKADLIDEYIITVVPISLLEGIYLNGPQKIDTNFKLKDVKMFDTGLSQLHYIKIK